MKLLPLALNLQNRRCVIFGAGAVARRKAQSLLECGAQLTVVAPHFADEWANFDCETVKRGYQNGDCSGAILVFAATNDSEVNRQIVEEARAANILCNVADEGDAGDFHSMATLRRGEICIGISTSGGSPALSKHLKEKIRETIGPEYESLLELLAERRALLPTFIEEQSQRAAFWREVLQSDILNLLHAGQTEEAKQKLAQLLSEPVNASRQASGIKNPASSNE